MENCCFLDCQPLAQCECREFLCSHRMGCHMIQGHSVQLLTQAGMVNSFPSVFTQISQQKEKLIQRGNYLNGQIGKLVSFQLAQLEEFQKRANQLSTNISKTIYDQTFKELSNLEQSQSKDLDQIEDLLLQLNSLVLSSGSGGKVVTWKGGKKFKTIEGHEKAVRSIAVSNSKQFIVSGSEDRTVRVWSLSTWQQSLVLKGHTDKVNSVVISSGNDFVVSGSNDKTIRVWNLNAGVQTQVLEGHTGPVNAVAISRGGNFIASGSRDKTIKVWNGEQIQNLEGHNDSVTCLAISNSDRFLVSGSCDKTVRIWTGQQNQILRGHTGTVNSVVISNNEQFIVSAGDDKAIKAWKVATGQRILTLSGHSEKVLSLSLSSDQYLVSSSSYRDYSIRIWNLKTAKEISTLRSDQSSHYSVNLI